MNSPNNQDLENQLKPYLLPNEKLEWVGCPEEIPLFDKSAYISVPFGLIFSGFALVWMISAYSDGASILFILFGMPFLAFGIHFSFTKRFYTRWKDQKTVYGYSSTRLFIKTQIRVAQVATYDLNTLSLETLVPTENKIATINFINKKELSESKKHPSLRNIKNSEDVYIALYKLIY
jgi:hypothetical protein